MLEPPIRSALESEARHHQELESKIADPQVVADPAQLRVLSREMGQLQKRVSRYRHYLDLEKRVQEAQEMAADRSDPDMADLAQAEVEELIPQCDELAEDLKLELLSRHEFSGRNVILEIRAGTGGDEATLFAGDLLRMYQRFAERNGFKSDEISAHRSEVGGYKEVSIAVAGEAAFDCFRFESGTHRVQRVPATETQGRIHTSAATVAVLAEPEEVEVDIKDSDLKIDTFRAGGPGGQNVNKTSSAIRITHEPSGIVVSCQDESSQHKNKSKALRSLRSRLFEFEQRQKKQARDSARREQIGSGDRSEKIRTYNFPQDRVTDHRIKTSFHNLPSILDGDIGAMVDSLKQHEVDQRLKAMQDESQLSSRREAG